MSETRPSQDDHPERTSTSSGKSPRGSDEGEKPAPDGPEADGGDARAQAIADRQSELRWRMREGGPAAADSRLRVPEAAPEVVRHTEALSEEQAQRAAVPQRLVPQHVPPPTSTPGVSRARPFQDSLTVLRIHKWLVGFATAALTALALIGSVQQTPMYESQAAVLVHSLPDSSGDAFRFQSLNMATESVILNSEVIARRVIERLRLPVSPRDLMVGLNVENPRDTEILVIRYAHEDPTEARRLAQAYGESYLAYRAERFTQGRALQTQTVEEELQILNERMAQIDQQRRTAGDPDAVALASEATAVQALIIDRQLRLSSLQRVLDMGAIVQPATLPAQPFRPNYAINLSIGIIAGLAAGVAGAFLRDRLDDRLNTRREAEDSLRAPILAAIPQSRGASEHRRPLLVTKHRREPPAAHAYRVLGTSLISQMQSNGIKSSLVTSSHAGEGVATTVANLGVALARMGVRVVVVSAQLRDDRLERSFESENGIGLAAVLSGKASIESAKRPTSIHNLQFVPSGPAEQNSAELLASEAMSSAITTLESSADLVLIEGAPVHSVSDALVVARAVGNVLFVIGPGGTARQDVEYSREELEKVGARIHGGVVTNLRPSRMRGFLSH